jgi:hypothetical protein
MLACSLLFCLPLAFALEATAETSSWSDDFSSEVMVKKNWDKYDRTVPDSANKQRFWQWEDGVLRGLSYPHIHPVGVMRNVSGTDVRLTCRIKLGSGAGIYVGFNGLNNGSDRVRPDQTTLNFRRAGIHILANDEVAFWDDHYAHLTAEELAVKGAKTSIGQTSRVKYKLEKQVWHDLKLEYRGKDLTLWLDGKLVSTHKTHSGDEAKRSFNFSVAHETKDDAITIAEAWFDDMKFEQLN